MRASWGQSTGSTPTTTCWLTPAGSGKGALKRFIYASSSSIYGGYAACVRRYTPQAGSLTVHLLAGSIFAISTINRRSAVSLRYFTVYGPRQRGSAIHPSHANRDEITIYGDGNQTRIYLYQRCGSANLACMETEVSGRQFNIGGGSRVSVNNILDILESVSGIQAKRRYIETQKGDVRHTFADTTRARESLGFKPSVSIEDGLRQEYEWLRATL